MQSAICRVCTCDDFSSARCKQHFPDGAGVAPEDHAVQAPCLLKRCRPRHEGAGYVAAGLHLLQLLSQPALHSKQHSCGLVIVPKSWCCRDQQSFHKDVGEAISWQMHTCMPATR